MNKNLPSYTLKTDGQIIEVHMAHKPHPEGLATLKDEITRLNKDHKKDVLVNMSTLEMPDPETREAADHFFKGLPYRRYAICCGIPSVNLSTKELIGPLSKNGRIKIFRREEDARAWLMGS